MDHWKMYFLHNMGIFQPAMLVYRRVTARTCKLTVVDYVSPLGCLFRCKKVPCWDSGRGWIWGWNHSQLYSNHNNKPFKRDPGIPINQPGFNGYHVCVCSLSGMALVWYSFSQFISFGGDVQPITAQKALSFCFNIFLTNQKSWNSKRSF